MNLNDLLFLRQQMQAQMPGGDATLGSTGVFVPRGMPPSPLTPQTSASMLKSRLPTASLNAVTDPTSVPFFAGGPSVASAAGNMPQFADPRVQAMLPPVPGPARNVGPVPGAVAPAIPNPPRRPEYDVKGYSKGLANAGPGAQAYADQFAGGDLSKVRSRLINIDGEMKNDYYTRGLLDGPMQQAQPEAPAAAVTQDPNLLMRIFGGLFGGGQ